MLDAQRAQELKDEFYMLERQRTSINDNIAWGYETYDDWEDELDVIHSQMFDLNEQHQHLTGHEIELNFQ